MSMRPLPNGLVIESLDYAETAFLYREIFVERQYAPDGLCLPEHPTVVDVGANIGIFSLFALAEWRPVRLVAVEPFSHVVHALRHNLRPYAAARVLHAAVGASEGEARFEYYPSCSVMSGRAVDPVRDRRTLIESGLQRASAAAPEVRRRLRDELEQIAESRFGDVTAETVAQLTLRQILAEHCPSNVDLLKIDVEGDELVALGSLGDQARRVSHLLVEVDVTRVSAADVEHWLDGHGFAGRRLQRGPGDLATMEMIFASRRV